MENQIVVFELDHEHYGVDIASVESIIKMQEITHVPHAPVFVKGIINLRGRIVPVIDLRNRFGLAEAESDSQCRIVIVCVDDAELGMIVDGVSEVLIVPENAIEPAPRIATTIDLDFYYRHRQAEYEYGHSVGPGSDFIRPRKTGPWLPGTTGLSREKLSTPRECRVDGIDRWIKYSRKRSRHCLRMPIPHSQGYKKLALWVTPRRKIIYTALPC